LRMRAACECADQRRAPKQGVRIIRGPGARAVLVQPVPVGKIAESCWANGKSDWYE